MLVSPTDTLLQSILFCGDRNCKSPDGTGFASFLDFVLWLYNLVSGKFTSTGVVHHEKRPYPLTKGKVGIDVNVPQKKLLTRDL